jgi:hypothetical protein
MILTHTPSRPCRVSGLVALIIANQTDSVESSDRQVIGGGDVG